MTNLERLKQVINVSYSGTLDWMQKLGKWCDPDGDGWRAKDIQDFLSGQYDGESFAVGDILHLKNSSTYGVVTYINNEEGYYSILMDSGKTLNHSYDFLTAERMWESTGRKMPLNNFLQEILPNGMRRDEYV